MADSVRTTGHRRSGVRRGVILFATGALVVGGLTVAAAPAAQAASAPGAPGALSHFDLARKDCLGTARNTTSKVWYTVAGRRAVRRLLPDHRQHQRRDPAVRRHRRLDVHRSADARHDLHGRALDDRGWPAA